MTEKEQIAEQLEKIYEEQKFRTKILATIGFGIVLQLMLILFAIIWTI